MDVMTTSAKDVYNKLAHDRDDYLERARTSSSLTIPALIPPDGHTGASNLPTPYQSVGARGVNNISSKLLMSLLPTSQAFFRMHPDASIEADLDADPDLKLEVVKALAAYEKAVMRDVDRKGDRVVVFEMLKHLIVGGNILILDNKKTGLKLFHLDKYVCRRDPNGTPVEIIVKESFDKETLPKSVREMVDAFPTETDSDGGSAAARSDRPSVDVYTSIRLDETGNRYTVHQEVGTGQMVPGSQGSYPKANLPWHALRLIRVDGEDYGRGYVEEYLGDLQSLEGLRKAIVQGSAAASKVLFLVKPNSTTRVETIEKAPNGAIREGNADDVTVVQLGKFNDFRVAQEVAQQITEHLSMAFLLNTSVRRNAERVTAEEIRFVAEELEQGLGGIFSILTQEFQLPYVQRRIRLLVQSKVLPALPEGVMEPIIITGMEALGRGMDRERLIRFVRTAAETVGPEAIQAEMNIGAFLEQLALADGINTKDLFKTKEQKAEDQQRQQMQMMVDKLGPNAMKVMGDMANNPNIQNQGAPDGEPIDQSENG